MNAGFYLFFINLSKIFFIFLNMVFIKLTHLGLFDFLKNKIFQLFYWGLLLRPSTFLNWIL